MSVHIVSELATPDEVAQELRTDRASVMRMIRRGEVDSVKFGKQVRVPWSEVGRLRVPRRLVATPGHHKRLADRSTV